MVCVMIDGIKKYNAPAAVLVPVLSVPIRVQLLSVRFMVQGMWPTNYGLGSRVSGLGLTAAGRGLV